MYPTLKSALLGIGGTQIERLKAMLRDGVDKLHTRRVPAAPHHALTEEDVEKFLETCSDWELEEGFPCSHRRPRHYFISPEITFKDQWEIYASKVDAAGLRVISYERWLQYVHYYFPGLRRAGSKEDVCDAYIRIDVALDDPTLDAVRREELNAEKALHTTAAIDQRRAMSAFIKQYVSVHTPMQHLSDNIIPDHCEGRLREASSVDSEMPLIFKSRILAEVFLFPYFTASGRPQTISAHIS
jgi:hypothetical protein